MALENDIETMLNSIGLELYDTATLKENEQLIYRISVIKEGGVSLDDCVEATHLLSPLLDTNPPVGGEYRLEVSSPGIERKLKTLNHFSKSIGENVEISTISKEKYSGKLITVDGENITINDGEKDIIVDFKSISKAKTFYQW